MAKNHYVTKRKRRNKNKNRKDYTSKTMYALRELALVENNQVKMDMAEVELRVVSELSMTASDYEDMRPENNGNLSIQGGNKWQDQWE